MDNATEALLIAGGILLGILTITALVYMFNNLSIMGNAQEKREETKRLAEWNSEWEAYNKMQLRGAEVLTVVNKAKQNNSMYEENSKYNVNVEINGKDNYGNEINISNIAKYKRSIFECTKMSYNSETGRVNTIIFSLLEFLDQKEEGN